MDFLKDNSGYCSFDKACKQPLWVSVRKASNLNYLMFFIT